jgi:peptidoglycan hydrolase-like protein with peptidoglycan-binding domain
MAKNPAHGRPDRKAGSWWTIVGICAVVVALLATGGVLLVRNQGVKASADQKPKILPLDVVSTTPTNQASSVAPSTTITVDLSTALASDSPMPTLSPPVAGSWSAVAPNQLEFVADGPLVPGSSETLTVPGGTAGLLGAQGQHLTADTTATFTVAPGSTLRLQQLLAQLGYLPVSFTPATQPTSPQDEADAQQGTFSWRWANQPASLTSLWNAGQDNEITKGAIMSFESLHGLKTDGLAGPQVWTDLLQAAATGANDPQAYGYVYVSQNLPETTTVYQNGSVAYSTLANTGVPGASTAPGTFTVYSRFRVTTMSGTNPDGSKYSDPGIPWVSYFNGGDALHGFVRAHYGFPQSDGCVEMPPANAEVVWPMTPIGTLVTVS